MFKFVHMKKYVINIVKLFAIILSVYLVACQEKPKTTDIITKKPIKVQTKDIQKVGDYAQTRSVEWLGETYSVFVKRVADASLPLIKDETGAKYYDNTVTLTINRPDGSVFFSRKFTKSDFMEYVGDEEKRGALLGVVLDHAKYATLYFAASVGSPDKTSDEYVPLVMSISRGGEVSIKKDTHLDTVSEDADEGV